MNLRWRSSTVITNATFLMVDGSGALRFSVISPSDFFGVYRARAGDSEMDFPADIEGGLASVQAWVESQYVMNKGDV
jgi:hypothetical protein